MASITVLAQTLSRWKDKVINGSCLKFQINIDGTPLFKSSVAIGLYSGTKKPDSFFLKDFASELTQLERGL